MTTLKILVLFSILVFFVFPIQIPELDDRTFGRACPGISRVVLEDPNPEVHTESHIVFGDGRHGRIPALCPADPITQ